MFTNIALLIARVLLGIIFIGHGSQKLFGWFGGYGLAGTGGFFESVGLKPGLLFAFVAGLGELVGGVLVLLGWLNPIGPALIVAVMLVAIITVHLAKGFWNTNGGYEFNLACIAGALAIAASGGGTYSVDAVAPVALLSQPNVALIIFAVAIVAALGCLVLRRAPKPANA
ncbi:MAG: DoxX family protein [Candidatus Eremiobacteraeota bacterium]|nr:DoxX family protein [Candidatus Eremiobacteraeota bacterium]